MSHLEDLLGPSPVATACMAGFEGTLNLAELTNPRPPSTLQDFCWNVSDAIGHAAHFPAGSYAEQGVTPRDRWAFWAPIYTMAGVLTSVIILDERIEAGGYHYQLCFHDPGLRTTANDCVLHAQTEAGSLIGRAEPLAEGNGGVVVRFVLDLPNVTHSVGFYPATQFS